MEKPSKILYLNHVAYIGGAEVALLDLLTHIDRERYTPVLLTPEGELLERAQALKIRCGVIPVLPGMNRYNLARFIGNIPGLLAHVKREVPMILHANTNFTAQYAGVLARGMKIGTVGHIQDIEPLGRIGRWTVRQNTRLIALSQAVKMYLLDEQVPEDRIVCIQHGVDTQTYHPSVNSAQDVAVKTEQDHLYIGLIGQLGERKGHLYFLEAARALLPIYPHLQFWIVGKEPAHSTERYTEHLRQYVSEHGLEAAVSFLGYRTDIPQILEQLDILVVPSLQEPFGKIVIEGMAMQKPVIASNVGGIREIVADGNTGFLIPPANAPAIRQALEALIRNPEQRQRMGFEGRRRVEQYFSIERTVRQTEQVYEHVIHGQSSCHP